ncbi:MAG TPA: ABC transporter permease [Anaerolineaceae bacterium]
MVGYIFRRSIYSILLLIFAATMVFFIVNLVPGNPYDQIRKELAERNPLKVIPESHWDRLDRLIGLDKPLHERYLIWLSNMLRGNFGNSWSIARGEPVLGMVLNRVPYTLVLMLLSSILAILFAIASGVYSALRPYTDGDLFVTLVSFFGMSFPSYWFGILLISLFSGALRWLPPGGVADSGTAGDFIQAFWRILTFGHTNPQMAGEEGKVLIDGLKHLVMPVITLSFVNAARWSRFVRASMLEVLGQEYIRAARAKGVHEWQVICKHVLSNTLVTLITVVALDIPLLFTGSFMTEFVFSWPGINYLFVNSLKRADWPVLQGILVVNAFLFVLINFLTDLIYGGVDPRVRVWNTRGEAELPADFHSWRNLVAEDIHHLVVVPIQKRPMRGVVLGGVILGITIGLFFSWQIAPVEWKDTHPDSLEVSAQVDVLRMAVESYAFNPQKELAVKRWQSLGNNRKEILSRLMDQPGGLAGEEIYLFSKAVAEEP